MRASAPARPGACSGRAERETRKREGAVRADRVPQVEYDRYMYCTQVCGCWGFPNAYSRGLVSELVSSRFLRFLAFEVASERARFDASAAVFGLHLRNSNFGFLNRIANSASFSSKPNCFKDGIRKPQDSLLRPATLWTCFIASHLSLFRSHKLAKWLQMVTASIRITKMPISLFTAILLLWQLRSSSSSSSPSPQYSTSSR